MGGDGLQDALTDRSCGGGSRLFGNLDASILFTTDAFGLDQLESCVYYPMPAENSYHLKSNLLSLDPDVVANIPLALRHLFNCRATWDSGYQFVVTASTQNRTVLLNTLDALVKRGIVEACNQGCSSDSDRGFRLSQYGVSEVIQCYSFEGHQERKKLLAVFFKVPFAQAFSS